MRRLLLLLQSGTSTSPSWYLSLAVAHDDDKVHFGKTVVGKGVVELAHLTEPLDPFGADTFRPGIFETTSVSTN